MLVAAVIAGGAGVLGLLWYLDRRAAARETRLLASLGLSWVDAYTLSGLHRDVTVEVVRSARDRVSYVRAVLSGAWDPWSLDQAAVREVLDRLLEEHSDARVTGGRLQWRSAVLPWISEGLRDELDAVRMWAHRLEAASLSARTAEELRGARWRDGLPKLGLLLTDTDCAAGSYQGCQMTLQREPDGPARLFATLGPDLPEGLHIRRGHRSEANPPLGPGVEVSSASPARTVRLLAHEQVASALRTLFAQFHDATIENGTLTVPLTSWGDLDALERELGPICAAIRAFQDCTDWPRR